MEGRDKEGEEEEEEEDEDEEEGLSWVDSVRYSETVLVSDVVLDGLMVWRRLLNALLDDE